MTKRVFVDQQQLGSQRQVDAQGFLRVERNPLSRVGVFPYKRSTVTGEAGDDMVMVLRPADELFKEASMATLRGKPITVGHTMLSSLAVKGDEFEEPEKVGVHGAVGDNLVADLESGILYGPINVWTAEGKKAIDDDGKDEISLGYRAAVLPERGEYEGQAYEFKLADITYNHCALVPDGRMGSDIRVLDHKETTMSKTPKWKLLSDAAGLPKDSTRDQVIAALRGIPENQVAGLPAKDVAFYDAMEEVKDNGGEAMMTPAEMQQAIGMLTDGMKKLTDMFMGMGKPPMGDNDPKLGDPKLGDNDDPLLGKPPMGDNDPMLGKPPVGDNAMSQEEIEKKIGDAVQRAVGDALEKTTQQAAKRASGAELAKRASEVVGFFDHADMTETQVAEYVLGKIKPHAALEGDAALGYVQAFLDQRNAQAAGLQPTKTSGSTLLQAYLN